MTRDTSQEINEYHDKKGTNFVIILMKYAENSTFDCNKNFGNLYPFLKSSHITYSIASYEITSQLLLHNFFHCTCSSSEGKVRLKDWNLFFSALDN